MVGHRRAELIKAMRFTLLENHNSFDRLVAKAVDSRLFRGKHNSNKVLTC